MKIKILPFPHAIRWKQELPNGFKGTTKGPVVTLQKGITLYDPIYAHEVQHVCQYWNISLLSLSIAIASLAVLAQWWILPYTPACFALYPILYTLSDEFRYRMEIDAYAEQVKHYGQSVWEAKISQFTSFIMTRYDLKDSPPLDVIAEDLSDAVYEQ